MKSLYTLFIYFLTPFFLFRLFWKSRLNPAYRKRWRERFGLFADTGIQGQSSIWIHAVSVGEVQATQQLVKQLKQLYPDKRLVMSTTTPTGAERLQLLYADEVKHYFFPYDLPGVVKRWISHVRPVKVILMETEVWPNLLQICKQKNIPVILANGRLSEKSCQGYNKLGLFSRSVFQSLSLVAAQSPQDAARFARLGVSQSRLHVTGSVKFDTIQPAIVREQAEAMRRLIGAGRSVWIAASTREGEEEAVLAAHKQICQQVSDALLILVPRHPERFDRVAQLSQQRGFNVVRRSENRPCDPGHNIFIGDSMGELSIMYQTADVAFVGGSLVDTGGQNVLEPASFGLPVLFGPSMFNFAAISELLLMEQAAIRVDDATQLAEQVIAWMNDASERTRYGENGRRVVDENRGATDRLVKLIQSID